ncbi:hypothetical protein I3842_07G071700 [Carya illinoinensis]|uniref:Uncharacterized protein n=1 Tax=Carya illinoinensis TaxID=32201 RepID=A0A922EJE4_CARIL|nr:hypothetical protein I3842_07G071700 [Carya illinoinensis]
MEENLEILKFSNRKRMKCQDQRINASWSHRINGLPDKFPLIFGPHIRFSMGN